MMRNYTPGAPVPDDPAGTAMSRSLAAILVRGKCLSPARCQAPNMPHRLRSTRRSKPKTSIANASRSKGPSAMINQVAINISFLFVCRNWEAQCAQDQIVHANNLDRAIYSSRRVSRSCFLQLAHGVTTRPAPVLLIWAALVCPMISMRRSCISSRDTRPPPPPQQ